MPTSLLVLLIVPVIMWGTVVTPGVAVAANGSTPSRDNAGSIVDPASDAPSGTDITELRATYDSRGGTLTATVNLSEEALLVDDTLDVSYGVLTADGTCVPADRVRFFGHNGFQAWSGTDIEAPGPLNFLQRLDPVNGLAVSTAITLPGLVAKHFDCAVAQTASSVAVPEVYDATAPLALVPGATASTLTRPDDKALVQLNYNYNGVLEISHGRALVQVTCLTTPGPRCHGVLTIRRQQTHQLYGTRRYSRTPGRAQRVSVTLNAVARHRLRAPTHVNVRVDSEPTGGIPVYTKLQLGR
jgi:hypothetical protein